MGKYAMTVIDRCGEGACRCCGQQFAERYTVELTSDEKSERAAVCMACAQKLRANAEQRAEPTETDGSMYLDDSYDPSQSTFSEIFHALMRFPQKLTPLIVSIPYLVQCIIHIILLIVALANYPHTGSALLSVFKFPLVLLAFALPTACALYCAYTIFSAQTDRLVMATWASFAAEVVRVLLLKYLYDSLYLFGDIMFAATLLTVIWPVCLSVLESDRIRQTAFGCWLRKYWFTVPLICLLGFGEGLSGFVGIAIHILTTGYLVKSDTAEKPDRDADDTQSDGFFS